MSATLNSTAKRRIFDGNTQSILINHNYFLSIPQKVTLPINCQEKSEVQQESKIEISRAVPRAEPSQDLKQSMLQGLGQQVPINELESFFMLTKQNNIDLQQSRFGQSQLNAEFYTQLELEAEGYRERVKQDAHKVHFILEKHKKINQQRHNISNDLDRIKQDLLKMDKCTQYSKLSKDIKYKFNQLESKHDELRDLYNESYNYMQVMSVMVHEKVPLLDKVSESEFVSITTKLFSEIELYARKYEESLSEQRRLSSVSKSSAQYKEVCQALLDLNQQFGQYDHHKEQQMLKVQAAASAYFRQVCSEIQADSLQYNKIIVEIRTSMASIEKLEMLRRQLSSQDQESKLARRKIKASLEEHYQYFNVMRNKITEKCLLQFC